MNTNLSSSGIAGEIVSTITSKGQVTIPAAVRHHLGVSTRDKIAFILADNGEVKLTVPRYPTVESLRGAAGTLPEPLSWKVIERIAHEDHIEKAYPTGG